MVDSKYEIRFGVLAGTSFYDDSDAPNALAYPGAIFPDRPDGTVLLGATLLQKEKNRVSELDNWSLEAIAAHEFGHILQYRSGMTPEGPWQMEPHADFMAGWYLRDEIAHDLEGPHLSDEETVEMTIRTFFQIGDYAFNNRTHHGEPEFRAAMVRAGFESRKP